MDAEVKNEEVAEDGQILILIEPKQEVDEPVEWIEPKVELIDEMDVKKEEVDDREYQHIIPHEYLDYTEQHTKEEQLTNSRKRPTDDALMPKRNRPECMKCGIEISPSNMKRHTIRHTGLKMFECPVSQCSFKAYTRCNVTYHMKNMHKSCTDPVIKNEMTDEEIQVWNNMVHECFPAFKDIKYTRNVSCQLCLSSVSCSRTAKRAHSIEHIYPLLFKCGEQDCDFSTNHFQYFARHVHIEHKNVFDSNDRKLQLLKEKVEIQKWTDMCFGDSMNDDTTETVDYPAPVAKKQYTCRNCNKVVTEDNVLFDIRRAHAIEHVNSTLYKCRLPDCQFQTKCLLVLNRHQTTCHGSPFVGSGTKVKLTTAQMAYEIERMLSQCFPETVQKENDN